MSDQVKNEVIEQIPDFIVIEEPQEEEIVGEERFIDWLVAPAKLVGKGIKKLKELFGMKLNKFYRIKIKLVSLKTCEIKIVKAEIWQETQGSHIVAKKFPQLEGLTYTLGKDNYLKILPELAKKIRALGKENLPVLFGGDTAKAWYQIGQRQGFDGREAFKSSFGGGSVKAGNESFLGFFKKWWEEDPISYWHIAPKKNFKTTLRDESVLYAGHDTMQNAIAEFTARANEVPFTIDPSNKDPIRVKDRSVLKAKLILQRYIFSPKDINVTKKNSDGSIEIRWKTTPELESNDDITVEEMISMCGRRTTNPDNRLYSDRQKAIAALTNCGSFPRADVVEPIAKEKFLCGYSFELELASFSHRPSNAQISEWNKAISAQHLKYHVTWYERADQDDVVLCIAEIV